jgi:hypothetical protein
MRISIGSPKGAVLTILTDTPGTTPISMRRLEAVVFSLTAVTVALAPAGRLDKVIYHRSPLAGSNQINAKPNCLKMKAVFRTSKCKGFYEARQISLALQ